MNNRNPLRGKTALITGATGGIGAATVRLLIDYGVHVVIAARNPDKFKSLLEEVTETAKQKVKDSFSQKQVENSLEFIKADLSSIEDVKNCALQFKEKYNHLDILINNVGGFFTKRNITRDGYELTFVLNYLCAFILTNLLLPTLKNSKNAHIINIASIEQKHGNIFYHDLNGEKHYFGLRAYAQSKLALVMFTRQLSEILKESGIYVNAVHPGIVKTKIAQDTFRLQSLLYRLLKYTIAITPEKAAENIVNTLIDRRLKNITGACIKKRKLGKFNPISNDREKCKKIWNISVELGKLPESFKID
ncbi:MAG: SDR family NAD(P)-dependent oxidoreductase [Spirochaetales bacterium]|nr:SDR family NAD(P)-dependent oxidoreductase [Spirochaetales bacterium]